MAKNIEAYYQSENDAESARAKLNTLNANNIMVEEIPSGMNTRLLVPFMSSGDMATSTTTGAPPVAPAPMENGKEKNDSPNLTHFLHFQVEEEDYRAALEILQESGSYMDQSALS